MSLQQALDAAVIAYRVQPSPHNLACLLQAAQEYHEDFLRREREEALARALERNPR